MHPEDSTTRIKAPTVDEGIEVMKNKITGK
jgi:hypothetical protein